MLASTLWKASTTYDVNYNTTGDKTVATIPAGRRWGVMAFRLESASAVTVILKSASTAIATFQLSSTTPMIFAAGTPIMVARAAGDDLVLNLGGAVLVTGFFTAAEMA